MTPLEKFEEWFERPLKELESLKGCNAAFLAFMVSFGLFERFIKSILKEKGIKGSPKNFRCEAATVLGVPYYDFDKFWGMYRDGIQHYLQPKVFESDGIGYGWKIDASYGDSPELIEEKPKHIVIKISPWKWSKRVVDLWRSRIDLLEKLESYPLGKVDEE